MEKVPVLNIDEFIEDGAKDLSKYGLDDPRLSLSKDNRNFTSIDR